jgi:hypothetical protein
VAVRDTPDMSTGGGAQTNPLRLQQNPLFTLPDVPDSSTLLQDLGCAELVLSALHPCIREALEAKDRAVKDLLDCTARLNVAATLLICAKDAHVSGHAVDNANACTELAVIASKDAVQKWYTANARVVQRIMQHPVSPQTDLHLLKEYTEFVRQLQH